jgi:hypothetical protein
MGRLKVLGTLLLLYFGIAATSARASIAVRGLDPCSPGPGCDYGPIEDTFPTYGNVAPVDLGDCTFAAAADWEQIVLRITPDPTAIGYEFAAAQREGAGLSQRALFAYWREQGIGGVVAAGFTRYTPTTANVENGVRDYGGMLVTFRFTAGDGFSYRRVRAGAHEAVVDGFTPTGPLVVTWGHTWQMTWEQWDYEVTGMWGVAIG